MSNGRLGQEVLQGLKTPAIFLVIVLAISTGLKLNLEQAVSLRQVPLAVSFAAFCLSIFHLVAWVCKAYTNEKSLKFIECLYLGLAFLGIYGVVDVQTSIARRNMDNVFETYLGRLESLAPCVRGEKPEACRAVDIALNELKEHRWSYYTAVRLQKWHAIEVANGRVPPSNPAFWETIEQLAKHTDELGALMINDEESFNSKLFGFYILILGLSLRMTKSSAEIFEWHAPKSSSSESVLPTEEVDAHNSA